MATAQQSCHTLHSALLSAGFNSTFDEKLAMMTPGMYTIEIDLEISSAMRTTNGMDTLIQFSDQYGAKISARLLSVPNDKIVQYILACNALNSEQQYVKYHIASEDQVLYAERDFFFADDSFYKRVISYLPQFKENVSDATPILIAARNT